MGLALNDGELWLLVVTLVGALLLALAALVVSYLVARNLRTALARAGAAEDPSEGPLADRIRHIDRRLSGVQAAVFELRHAR